ncbi:MAG: class II glutamine amidotransferase [Clostridium sp.]|nr:class II glutamine amidotransferase [Clostridium sp.]
MYCFDSNPDGVGLMYQDNNSNKVIIQKGFMSFDDLITAVKNLNSKIDITANNIVLHFRYATQGSITEANTHPFPITANIKELKQTTITTNTAMVHNGIIPFCSDYNSMNKLSDTQIFIRDYLSKMDNRTIFNPAVLALIEELTNSKFIFMDNSRVKMLGRFIEDKGIYYSNDTYKKTRWYKTSKSKNSKKIYMYSIIDYCAYCGQYGHVDKYNGLCSQCQEILK